MQVIQYSAHDQWYQDDSYHYLVHDIDSGFILLLSERFRRVAHSSRPQSCFLWRMPSATHNDACIVHLHLQPQPGIFGCITHFWRLTQHVAEMWLTDDSLSSNVQCLVNSVVSSSIGVYPPQCVFKTLSLRITRCRHMFSVLVPSPVSRLRSRRTISRCCFAKLPIILGPSLIISRFRGFHGRRSFITLHLWDLFTITITITSDMKSRQAHRNSLIILSIALSLNSPRTSRFFSPLHTFRLSTPWALHHKGCIFHTAHIPWIDNRRRKVKVANSRARILCISSISMLTAIKSLHMHILKQLRQTWDN